LPGDPETYYIHDIALLPELRGTGAAARAVALVLARAGNEKLATVSLVAVNNSAIWMRHGFRQITFDKTRDATFARKLRGYSNAAAFMVRQL
jgi:N-acetylglutamate synthase-like GNAT family acetyltransferase